VIDSIIILLVLFLSVKGFFNGFAREFIGFFGLIGGIFVASRAAPLLGKTVEGLFHIDSFALAKLIAFLVVLAIIWGGSSFVGRTFHALRRPPASTLSQAGGMGIAALKYFLIFSLIAASLLGSDLVRDNAGKYLKQSRLLPQLKHIGAILINQEPLPFRHLSKPTISIQQEKPHG